MTGMRKTPADIRAMKNPDRPLACLTAYTAPMAALLDEHCDLLLAGDSLGMVLYGLPDTTGVTLDMMIAHGAALVRGAKTACRVVDMPFGTYEHSVQDALKNARRILEETGCDAVKLEGGEIMAPAIRAIVDAGIPVMAHIGLQPQSSPAEGGFKIKGRTDEEVMRLLADAKAVEEAGAFCVVIEGTIEPVSRKLTAAITIPTIGIGASPACDGQILVTEDLLGLTPRQPKFVRKYADFSHVIKQAVKNYAEDVKSRRFPGPDNLYK